MEVSASGPVKGSKQTERKSEIHGIAFLHPESLSNLIPASDPIM
jgi:hypothetical protein